jgi:ribonuclease BN (tRNA processing enzyme)
MLEILFIGTGDAFGSGGRRNSAILCRERDHTLLLDCGPTTLVGMKQLGIDPLDIDAVAISHFHGDHASGTPFLLLEYLYERERTRPLEILGPPGIQQRIELLVRGFGYETERLPPYPVVFREFRVGVPIPSGVFSVTPYPAYHHPETAPHMVRVETDQRALFFTGDTGWHEALPEHVGDVSLLISECCMMSPAFEFHLSHERLVAERRRLRCQRMVLTHLGQEVLDHRARLEFETADDGLKLSL